ncbi:protein-tyrosine-phosphatase [Plasmodiophora brassicae]|uniref:protein-tyrosine-phosphatase n=1 Tax=Plasmodiophora brassicae TaxID=37360 RepID=A0A0G4IYE4_PLABS|nr:hypothetical protein PBRA_001432 [Plasmodiophora brassicae]
MCRIVAAGYRSRYLLNRIAPEIVRSLGGIRRRRVEEVVPVWCLKAVFNARALLHSPATPGILQESRSRTSSDACAPVRVSDRCLAIPAVHIDRRRERRGHPNTMLSMLGSVINSGTGNDAGEFSPETNVAEIIPGRLVFMCCPGTSGPPPAHSKNAILFTVDRVLNYEPFFADFGPLNLGQLYRFCQIVESKLQQASNVNRKVIMYTARGPQKKANAGYLVCAYQVLILKRTPEEAWARIAHISPGFIPFRDASMQACLYKLTILHCLQALAAAVRLKFFNVDTFDVSQYEFYERIENGDLNVIVPKKFVHFSGPSNTNRDADGYPAKTPNDYIDTFKKLGVTDIIRLNKKCYDKNKFTKHGFQHHEMYFIDGTTPSLALLERFMNVCEHAKGMVAVHCKAGLGRTGTCVGCYLMKFYRMTAAEVIAWLRICRPGSVLGPQQQFLEDMQALMWRENDKLRKTSQAAAEKKTAIPYAIEKQLANVSFAEEIATSGSASRKGDEVVIESQGNKLIHQKFDAQHRKSVTEKDIDMDSEISFENLPRALSHSR